MSHHQLHRWLWKQCFLWLPVLALLAWPGLPVLPPSAVSLWLVALVVLSYAFLWRRLGAGRTAADWVTGLRAVGLCAVIAAALVRGELGPLLWVGFILAVAGDLLGGWVARRYGGSAAGAMLDMETDQFVTLGLAVVAVEVAGVGPWLLLLPGYRYLNILFLTFLGRSGADPKPRGDDSQQGRRLCALMMILLLACLSPWSPPLMRTAAGALAVVLLTYSYGSDALFHLRQARLRSPAVNEG